MLIQLWNQVVGKKSELFSVSYKILKYSDKIVRIPDRELDNIGT